jgi:hypothetical protein
MARNFEGTTFSRLPGHYTRFIKVMNSVLWEIRGPYSFRPNDRNGLVHMLTETFQRGHWLSGELRDELRVVIQKRQHLFLYIDIRTSHTKHYSLDA